jgi:HEAT repeat protein
MRLSFLSPVALTLLLTGPSFAADRKRQKPADPPKPGREDSEAARLTELGGKSLKMWLKDLTSTDPGVVENAIRTLTLFGPPARAAVPILVKKLRYSYELDVSIKVNAAMFLGGAGLEDDYRDEAIRRLTSLLSDNQAIVRFHAALALGRIGPDARKVALKPLLYRLSDPATWEIRKASAMALATVAQRKDEPPEDLVADRLRDRLRRERCAQVRLEIAETLVVLGPPAGRTARLALTQTVERVADSPKEDTTVRIWAQLAVMRMTKIEQKRLAFLGKQLDDQLLGVRCQAAKALGMIGPDARSQLHQLTRALKDKEGLMVLWTIWALGQMGNKAMAAVPALERLAKETKDKGLQQVIKETVEVIRTNKPDKLEQPKAKDGKPKPKK